MENIDKTFKTPIYVRNAQKAYRERKKAQDLEGYNKRNNDYIKKYREKKKVEEPEQLVEHEIIYTSGSCPIATYELINTIDNLIITNK